jgi:16S rRNA (uracil1498-N3)-methyltransferase
MTRRRWIADQVGGDRAALIGSHADHLVRVLRARIGQKFDIAIGSAVRLGEIVSISEERVEFELGEELPALAITPVTLLLSIFKFDRLEWAIEKCTELGVARIVPVIAQRTQTHLQSSAERRVERWRRISREASEQSRRVAPTEVAAPVKLQEALTTSADLRLALSEVESAKSLKQALQENSGSASVAIAVGPEGGWSPGEEELFCKSGWISVSLGPTILRAETAAIAAVAVVMAEA